jgi:hypothetical protein
MNSFYTASGNPVTLSKGSSSVIRSEYISLQTAFDGVEAALVLKSTRAGDTYTGTHDYTGATIRVPTQSAGDNSTKAASTAYVDGVLVTSLALKANIDSPTLTGTPRAPTAAGGSSGTQIATLDYVNSVAFSVSLPGVGGNNGKFIYTDGASSYWAQVTATLTAFTPTGNIAATTVQAAIAELDTEKTTESYVNSQISAIPPATGSVLFQFYNQI